MLPMRCNQCHSEKRTYVANHDLLTGLGVYITWTISSHCPRGGSTVAAGAVTVHAQTGSLLVRTRIVRIKILIRKIASSTRLCTKATTESSTPESSTSESATTKAPARSAA